MAWTASSRTQLSVSRLDALAAWYSSLVLHNVLINFLEAKTDKADLKAANPERSRYRTKDCAKGVFGAKPMSCCARCCYLTRVVVQISQLLFKLCQFRLCNPSTALPQTLKTASPGFYTVPIPSRPRSKLSGAPWLLHSSNAHSLAKRQLPFVDNFGSSHNQLFGLFGFTAMYNFLDAAFRDKDVANDIRDVLENLQGL